MGQDVQTLELVMPSDFKFLGAVDAAVQDLARELSCPQRWINDFSTALIEACSNAIEHGNKYSKEKIVRVEVNLNGKQMIVRVRDQGDGFDFENASGESPTDPFSERGRGIMIMKALTDDVKYTRCNDGGLCIELVKTVVEGKSETTENTK